ncbi:MAG: CDP-diacylglycerol--glycerol-3-phosphate 3-phosphatidyltransferase [Ignavibacteriales bacterium]|nr:CDP-diacylglycerol--glycerol-3-phosphate 3-phosphatidyltransferase [Ignavibacteriales bacterium]
MKFSFSPPNQLTILRILLTPVFLAFLFSANPVLRQLSLLIFIVALLTDWYDGWVARRWGYITRWGTFLDPLADKIVTSAALLAFVYLDIAPAWPIWIIVVRDIAVTLLRSYSEFKGKRFDTSKFAKTKTFLQFVVIYYVLLLHIANETDFFHSRFGATIDVLLDHTLIYVLTVLIAVITVWTGISYLIDNRKTIRELTTFSSRVTESR